MTNKKITISLLAHVDAGKTTLSEAILYNSGEIPAIGRVDKGSTALDSHTIERERGISIFSHISSFDWRTTRFTLLDTPGHIDFFPETERTLDVTDYAVLVISATEGVTAHTMTLYNLARARRIPIFIFVNKTDISSTRRCDILDTLRVSFGDSLCDFNLENEDRGRFFEDCAARDEKLMSSFFSGEPLDSGHIALAVKCGNITPVIFGAALKNSGVRLLLDCLDTYTVERSYGESLFGAKVYKIATAEDGARLSYMKITSGSLKIKDTVTARLRAGEEISGRIEQIRLYSKDKFKSVKFADAGMIIAVPGLDFTKAGMGLGVAADAAEYSTPMLSYRLIFEDGTDVYSAYLRLAPLGEEEPSLGMYYDSKTRQIRLRLMGEIQKEVLTKIIKDRFGFSVSFGDALIEYMETISAVCYGAGHFEPLMHYAEVRLKLEPLPRGSGLMFSTDVPQDKLKLNWQRLILSHLQSRKHRGRLIGAPITDMKITLIAGRAHNKHTDGGDFREATYRALHQALMGADMILLEPTYDFEVTLPEENIGRLFYDIERMGGECQSPEFLGNGRVTVRGYAPVSKMSGYPTELRAYTKGEGQLFMTGGEYIPAYDEEKVIEEYGYDPLTDPSANPNSVFCEDGAGYLVPWYMVEEKMHTENPEKRPDSSSAAAPPSAIKAGKDYKGTVAEDRELMQIFEATYGKVKPRYAPERKENRAPKIKEQKHTPRPKAGKEYLVIDGYNFIHFMPRLLALAKADLSHARDTLIRILSNYKGFKPQIEIILVFDAYRQKSKERSTEEYDGITVIYTKHAETADSYIEALTYKIKEPDRVRVVTADYTEQLVILGFGGIRVTPNEFAEELAIVDNEIREYLDNN